MRWTHENTSLLPPLTSTSTWGRNVVLALHIGFGGDSRIDCCVGLRRSLLCCAVWRCSGPVVTLHVTGTNKLADIHMSNRLPAVVGSRAYWDGIGKLPTRSLVNCCSYYVQVLAICLSLSQTEFLLLFFVSELVLRNLSFILSPCLDPLKFFILSYRMFEHCMKY